MPVSVDNSQLIYESLKEVGVEVVSALPETWLVHLIRMAEDDPEMTLVRLAKEEEGVGISMGAHLAGAKSAMLMQNHGFLASINGIVSGRIFWSCRSHSSAMASASERPGSTSKDLPGVRTGRPSRQTRKAVPAGSTAASR